MKEKITVRFILQMAAMLHRSVRRGEQCELELSLICHVD